MSESQVETLLMELAPQLAPNWGGATDEEIAALEAIAGRPLPAFYRWFLGRLGRSMGPLRYRSLDFSCKGVLEAYAHEKVDEHPRYLLVAYDHDPVYPYHLFYDLDRPARDDALVVSGEDLDDEATEDDFDPRFETLREMIAWGAVLNHGVMKRPQRCEGVLESRSGEVVAELGPVLSSFGVESAIETGGYCCVRRGEDVDFVSRSTPGKSPHLQTFTIGGASATAIRRLLGEITSATELELQLGKWDPPVS